MSLHPTALKIVEPNEIQIDWSDGQVRRYQFKELRDGCPCATCRELRRGEAQNPANPQPANPLQLNILSPVEAQPMRVVGMKPVGNYAYTVVFSDGHDTGIFPFALLRELGRVAE